ncbi:DUF4365 domain-containing protein [Streptomyces sp. NPDC006700]|uniref:DUF4365 domain-containing protein n=1 Tax=Streptomyces sp. NPDC006700 TaxID=3154479 RepID=UPI00340914DC
MPSRPQQHQIAARAESAVRSLWTDGGHAVDVIREDYGEDLLIQTCLRGRVDSSRIWVQVKGTAKDCSDSSKLLPSLSLKADQVLRWSRSSDLMIVVLWDVTNNLGWYTIPRGEFDHVRLLESQPGKVPLRMDRSRPFNRSAVDRLAWKARIGHADQHLSYALSCIRDLEEDLQEEEEEGGESQYNPLLEYSRGVAASTVYELAIAIGVFNHKGKLTQEFKSALTEAVKSFDGDTGRQIANQSIMWALVKLAHENCARNGLPESLIIELTEHIREMIFGDMLRRVDSE